MFSKHNARIRRIEAFCLVTIKSYHPEYYEQVCPLVRYFYAHCREVLKQNGLPFLISKIKESRLAVLRCITGEPLLASEVSITLTKPFSSVIHPKGGWPKWLVMFECAYSETTKIRVLLTLLTSFRSFILKAELDLQSIITESKSDPSCILDEEFDYALGMVNCKAQEVSWEGFHASSASGPAGPALISATYDLSNLPIDLVLLIQELGGERIKSYMTAFEADIDRRDASVHSAPFLKKPNGVGTRPIRRISYFSDKEGKTRTVALLDYWSQTVLKPIHQVLADLLKNLKTDCTFNQGRFMEILPHLPGPFHSLDLSNATDRMPLWLQKRVLSAIIGQTKAEAWASILTKYEYQYAPSGASALYRAGQPMGAYSSWPAMALTHHIIVHIAAWRAGKYNFDSFAILGDDIVIADDTVASEYKRLLVQLDMPFSKAKTHVSAHSFEFAKRWIVNRVEVTGYSIGGLLATFRSYPLLFGFIQSQTEHGWIITCEGQRDFVSSLYKAAFLSLRSERLGRLYYAYSQICAAESIERSILVSPLDSKDVKEGLSHGSRSSWLSVWNEISSYVIRSPSSTKKGVELLRNFPDPAYLAFRLICESRRRLAVRDTFNNFRFLDIVKDSIKGLSQTPNGSGPLAEVFNDLVVGSFDNAMRMLKLPEVVFAERLSLVEGFNLSPRKKKILDLRQAAVTKESMAVLREWLFNGYPTRQDVHDLVEDRLRQALSLALDNVLLPIVWDRREDGTFVPTSRIGIRTLLPLYPGLRRKVTRPPKDFWGNNGRLAIAYGSPPPVSIRGSDLPSFEGIIAHSRSFNEVKGTR